ncbi:ALP1-like protein [Tanacetum coccineum]
MFGATTYMIWQERNVRIFQAKNRTEDVITQLIIEQFMTSLMSLTVKDTNAVREMKESNNGLALDDAIHGCQVFWFSYEEVAIEGHRACLHDGNVKNYPVSWHEQYGRGIKKYHTIMLEAVASQDLWIWHAFFGVAGANNDINVLDNSSLFDDLLDDKASVAPYVCQESARKDVERAFGVLQGQDQKMAVFDWNEVYANPSRNMQRTWVERCETQRRKNKETRDREMHLSFQQNLMEHIWQQVDHEDEDY